MKYGSWRLALLIPILALSWTTGLFTAPSADCAGCSRAENYKPVYGGCRAQAGSVCYYCEYTSGGGGYSVCGENTSGSVSLCIDYQDLPPLPNF